MLCFIRNWEIIPEIACGTLANDNKVHPASAAESLNLVHSVSSVASIQ